MSFRRYYPVGDEDKPDLVPAYWYLLKKRKPAHVKSGQTFKVKAALKRIEAEMQKAKKGKMAC